jgi:tetratricopeptide (TPR) repeat protein
LAQFAKKEYDKAIVDYLKALELYPYDSDAYCNLSETYLYKGDFQNAWVCSKKAIKLSPKDSWYVHMRGKNLLFEGKRVMAGRSYSKALRLLKRELENKPTRSGYISAAWYALIVAKFQDAEKYARKGLELYPTCYSFHINLAHAYLLQGKKTEAFEQYYKFIENFKPNPKDVLKDDFSMLKMRYPKQAALIDETQKALGIE